MDLEGVNRGVNVKLLTKEPARQLLATGWEDDMATALHTSTSSRELSIRSTLGAFKSLTTGWIDSPEAKFEMLLGLSRHPWISCTPLIPSRTSGR
jgi:hypothetical protein